MDMNFNVAYCIKEAHSWGHDSFYNICKGTKEIVPWGSMDWTWAVLGWSFVGLTGITLLTLVTFLGACIYVEAKEYDKLCTNV